MATTAVFRRLLCKFVASNDRCLNRQMLHKSRGCSYSTRFVRCHSSYGGNIVASPYSDIHIPSDIPLVQHIMDKTRQFENRTALVNGITGETISYGALHTMITGVGSALVKMGISKGDVVTLFAPNSPEFAVMFLAIIGIGAVCSSVNPLYTSGELMHTLTHSESKLLVTTPDLMEVVGETVKHMPGLKGIISIGSAGGCTSFSSLLADDGLDFPEHLDVNPKEDLVALPYSSGTTGMPKGVMLTHYSVLANVEQIATEHVMRYTPDDVLVGVLPFFHIYGQVICMLMGLRNGSKIVTLPKFEPQTYLRSIQDHKATFLHVVPPIILFLAQHPMVDQYDLSSVHTAFTAAAPVGADIVSRCVERIWGKGNMLFRQGYGLTETSPLTHSHSTNPAEIKYESIGYPIPNTLAKVVDIETGADLEAGQEGEVCVKGPQLMKGYFKNQEATDSTIDTDGWLHSGDIGYFTKDKHFIITDRLKELIKYKGFQVAPAELEAVLVSHPAIEDAAVVGIPDERAGELPRAYIVIKQGEKLNDDDVHGFIKGRLASYKELAGGVEYKDVIPKTTSGKILRRQLKDEFLNKL